MSKPGALGEAIVDAGVTIDHRLTKSINDRMAEATPWRPGLLYADPTRVDTRWSNACARIGRICEGAQAVSNGVTAPSFEAACKTATMPRLAHEFLELRFYIATKDRPHLSPKTDHNPFRGMPDREAMGKFRALVEGICDRSTGKLGWWSTR